MDYYLPSGSTRRSRGVAEFQKPLQAHQFEPELLLSRLPFSSLPSNHQLPHPSLLHLLYSLLFQTFPSHSSSPFPLEYDELVHSECPSVHLDAPRPSILRCSFSRSLLPLPLSLRLVLIKILRRKEQACQGLLLLSSQVSFLNLPSSCSRTLA